MKTYQNWRDIKFPSDKEDWKKFEKNNNPHVYENITTSLKNNFFFLMITDDGKRQHYVAVKSLSVLLRGISLSNNADFYCLNCFHSYRTLNKLKKYEITCNNDDYCSVDMPKEHKKIKYLLGKKSLKVPLIIYADLKCLLKSAIL